MMTTFSLPLILAVSLSGGVGASLRYVVDLFTRNHQWPLGWSIATINIVGSLFVGIFTANFVGMPSSLVWILCTGLCAGFTTFSTHIMDLYTLWTRNYRKQAIIIALCTIIGSLTAVMLPLLLVGVV